MTVALRKTLNLAAFAGVALLVAAPTARAQSPSPASQARFVQMLLNRNAAAIQHQFNAINRQNALVAQQQNLANLVPANMAQARQICNALERIGNAIFHLNQQLEPGKFRIIGFLNQTGQILQQLSTQIPPGSKFFPLLQQAEQTFAQQVQEGQTIINRPPATPFVPSIACDLLGITPEQMAMGMRGMRGIMGGTMTTRHTAHVTSRATAAHRNSRATALSIRRTRRP
jgi:hypothetical protein